MKRTFRVLGTLGVALCAVALVAAMSLSFSACGGGGGRSSSASDFTYELSEDGKGIKITGYTGTATKVTVPAKIEDMPVVEIGEDAFRGSDQVGAGIGLQAILSPGTTVKNSKSGITSITLPKTITKIGSSAFYDCEALTEIRLPDDIAVIPSSAFSGCKALKKANLPKSLNEIRLYAFYNCVELTELTIPANLGPVKFTSFGSEDTKNGAFSGCGKLPIRTRQRLQELGYTGSF